MELPNRWPLHRAKAFRGLAFSTEALAAALAIYFSLFLNAPLWALLLKAQSHVHAPERWNFIWASVIGVTAFQFGLISLFLWGRLTKHVAVIMVLLTAATHFFMTQYGVQYDTSMLKNVFATNAAEASELMTPGLFWSVTKTSVLPVAAILLFPRARYTLKKTIALKAAALGASVAITAICVGLSFKTLSATVRNHKEARHLVLPASPIISALRIFQARAQTDAKQKLPLDPSARRHLTAPNKPLTIVLVIGETVRAQDWGLSGYQRQTTPKLASLPKEEVFNFPYAVSCGANTEVSVPCMFSAIGRAQYNQDAISHTESSLQLISKLGVRTVWIDNQSGCKGVCTDIPTLNAADYAPKSDNDQPVLDEQLVEAYAKAVKHDTQDELIVLHTLGNHGPAYYKRYPKALESFTPACHDGDLANCSQEEIRNAYDNAVLYTDSVLYKAIDQLKHTKNRDVALIYVSDHGESLGEKGIYLHGLPYYVAPNEQTHVPFLIWMPKQTLTDLHISAACLSKETSRPTHHDTLTHTLFGIYGIETSAYKKPLDLLSACRA